MNEGKTTVAQSIIRSADSKNLTATGDVATSNTALIGFYVNSTTGGTLALRKGGSGGTALAGTITPDIGFHAFPCVASGGLHASIGGVIDVTFFYQEI